MNSNCRESFAFEMIEESELESAKSINFDNNIQSSSEAEASTATSHQQSFHSKAKRYPWQPRFLTQFDWLEYNEETKIARYKLSKCKVYDTLEEFTDNREFYISFEFSRFKQHAGSQVHMIQLHEHLLPKNQTAIQFQPEIQLLLDTAIWTRITVAWTLAQTNSSINNFSTWI